MDKVEKEETRYFKDMVEYTDKLFGKLVARLDVLGLRENTLILFYGDIRTAILKATAGLAWMKAPG